MKILGRKTLMISHSFLMSVRKLSCRNVSFHGSDYDCNNGRFVTEGDYVDDGNDECFTLMVTIITIVVSVLHLSVMDYHHPEAVVSAACALQSFSVIFITFSFEALESVQRD